jgi:hypothetical protein
MPQHKQLLLYVTPSSSTLKSHVNPTTPKTILDHEPPEVVDIALQKFQKAGVELIEWRALRRMNVPVILKVSFNTLVCSL